jgi:hypothetical protein
MKNGDIVTVVTATGEYVGKLNESELWENRNWECLTLNDPRMLVMNEQGMGFARGICATGIENPSEATFANVIFVTETNEQIISAWRQATSGIIT